MPKLSKRWWTSIVAASFATLSLFPPNSVGAATGDMATGQSAGQTAGETIRGKFGSQDLLRQNILNPVTSSESPLETVDGSTAFPGQLSFPSSRKFLEVFMQPGPSGDLSTVIVGEDLNFDGTTDYSYRLPYPVSGVCANGIIACAPGTWTDCQHYLWTADATGRVSLQGTSPDNVGGCYCINSDCGSNLVWSNAQVILRDLGGGVVGAMQQANAGFTVSDVRLDSTTISYYGQDASRTTDASGSPSAASPVPPPQTAYLNNPLAIPGQAQSMAMSQSSDSSSLYNLVSGFNTNQQQNVCDVRRLITMSKPNINDVIVPLGGTGAVQYCGPDCIDVILGQVGDNYWRGRCAIFEKNFRVFVKQPDLIQSATIVRAKWDDYMQIWIGGNKVWSGPNNNFPPETAGACELSTSWNRNPNQDVTSYFQTHGEIQTKIRVSVTGGGEGYAFVRIRLKPDRCVIESSVLDGCAALSSRADCSLQEEKVDGVQTYHSANPTSLTPLPSSKTLTQGDCTETITQEWWLKERIYFCSSPVYDFSDTKTRYGQVVGSLTTGSSSASYQDMQRSNGGWVSSSETIGLMDLPDHDECEKACKTRRPAQDTQAVLAGHSEQFKTSTDSYDILYHTCVDDGCPTEPGEEILKDCQCLNDFAEAATIMQMLRLAGQDTICSDGVPK